jgi:hypothetical protein
MIRSFLLRRHIRSHDRKDLMHFLLFATLVACFLLTLRTIPDTSAVDKAEAVQQVHALVKLTDSVDPMSTFTPSPFLEGLVTCLDLAQAYNEAFPLSQWSITFIAFLYSSGTDLIRQSTSHSFSGSSTWCTSMKKSAPLKQQWPNLSSNMVVFTLLSGDKGSRWRRSTIRGTLGSLRSNTQQSLQQMPRFANRDSCWTEVRSKIRVNHYNLEVIPQALLQHLPAIL